MAGLRFYCFGNLELFAGSELLAKPATLKAQSLLAYLLRHRSRPFPRDLLMAMFWGDRPSRRARRSLSTALWQIRRCLPGDDLLQADNHTVAWQGEAWLDVVAFEQMAVSGALAELETAVALYRGDFLDGFYDEWVIDERYQLHGRFLDLLARLTSRYEAGDQHQQALATALRLLAQDNLQESAHRAAMRAYARLGQRNAALEQYQRCREIVAGELGVEPMAETAALFEAIRDGRFEVGRAVERPAIPVGPLVAPPPAGQNPFDPSRPEMLVGRAKESAFLRAGWRDALDGQVKLLLVSGEAGVGKTQLVNSFAARLQQEGLLVLQGRCYEFERLLPYQPIAEALRPLVAGMAQGEIQRLPGWVIAGLSRLVPEIRERGEPDALAGAPETGQDQTHLFHAVAHFLTALASTRPLLVVIDDLHWATESTLELLHYLVRFLAGRPALLLGVYRQEAVGPHHLLRAWQQSLRQAGAARRLRLQRLPAAAVEGWIVAMSGAGETAVPLARRLFAESEGNPFFVVQMIKSLFETGAISLVDNAWHGRFDQVSQGELPLPATIRQAIESRVRRLPPETQEGLQLAAVLGQEFDFDLLNAAWQRGEEATLSALDNSLRARLVEEGTGAAGRDYAFTHHKIQELIYAGIPRRRRQQSHARVAAMMEALRADQLDVWSSELAFHYRQGQKVDRGLAGKAVTYLRRAGEQAAAQFAHEEAIRYFSQALEILAAGDVARIPLLLAREKGCDNLGARAAQAADLAELAGLVRQLPAGAPESADQQTAVALRRSNYAVVTGDFAAAMETARAAVPLARTAETRIELICAWGLALYHQGEHEAARARVQEALAGAQSAGLPSLEAKALNVMAMIAWRQGRYEEARRYLETVLAVCQRPDFHDLTNEGNALGNLGIISRYQGEFAGAESYFRRSLAIWRQTGYRRGEAMYLINLGVVAFDTADYTAARHHLRQALAIGREIGDRVQEQTALSNLSVAAVYAAEFDEAAHLSAQSLAISREIGNRTWEGIALTNLGLIAFEQGRFDEAVGYYEQSLEIRQEQGDRRGQGIVWHGLGDVARCRQDLAAARSYCRQAVAVLQEIGDQAEEGLALNKLARVEMANGRYAAAQAHIEAALRLSRAINSPLLEGRVLANLALLSHHQDRPQAALARAQEALAIARRIGAPVLAGDAWFACGLALEGNGRLPEAVEAYTEAIAIRRRIGQTHRLAQPRARRQRIS